MDATPDDDALLRQFEACTLPLDQWTHRMHVKVAFSYLQRFPFDDALNKMRCGIQRYNKANSVPEGLTSGYHETMTCAFMRIIAATMRAQQRTLPANTSEEFCANQPQLLQRLILRLFYSPQRIMTEQAKREFVAPDLAPLPRVLEEI